MWFVVIIVGIGLVILIVMAARAHAEQERRRISALWAWAQSNGFAFSKDDPQDLATRFEGIGDIGKGHSRYAFEVLRRGDPIPVFMFRYHFATTETRTVTSTDSQGNTTSRTETYEQDHWRAYLIAEIGPAFPGLMIRPENWGDKIAGFLGFDDIDFESEEFSSRYLVKSEDKQFAYAIIHPQMMEWLLPQHLTIGLEKGCVVLSLDPSQNEPAKWHAAWTTAAGFINRIPPFVWQDYGKRERVELPLTKPPTPVEPVQRESASL